MQHIYFVIHRVKDIKLVNRMTVYWTRLYLVGYPCIHGVNNKPSSLPIGTVVARIGELELAFSDLCGMDKSQLREASLHSPH